MKLHYDQDTDSLYIDIRLGLGVETRERPDGPNVGPDSDGSVIGFDLYQASQRWDLSMRETEALPMYSISAKPPNAPLSAMVGSQSWCRAVRAISGMAPLTALPFDRYQTPAHIQASQN